MQAIVNNQMQWNWWQLYVQTLREIFLRKRDTSAGPYIGLRFCRGRGWGKAFIQADSEVGETLDYLEDCEGPWPTEEDRFVWRTLKR